MTILPLGDSAVAIVLGTRIDASTLRRVNALAAAIRKARGPGIEDVVPAYASVTVFFEPAQLAAGGAAPLEAVRRLVESCAAGIADGSAAPAGAPREIEVPVCYGGEHGPDLGEVATHCGLGPGDVIERHSGAAYEVYAIGFVPGFPYLGGLPPSLRTPRRVTPRTRVPAGSVGIGGSQTGVYPFATPGGWQIIGRTPLALFAAGRTPPALLRAGDRVRFRAISAEEFSAWK